MPARAAIYLDANAGAPLRAEAAQALIPFLSLSDKRAKLSANPSSLHEHGREAKKLLSRGREQVARSLGSTPSLDPIVFTSSGTEANQTAIRTILESALQDRPHPHWITSPVEHESVLSLIPWFKSRGGSVSTVAVDASGAPQAASLPSLICTETALISVIWVNNESGVITDIPAFVREARPPRIPLHVDGAQAWGKLKLELPSLGADSVAFSGYKIGALMGTGVLWIQADSPALRGKTLAPLLFGRQERGRRGGSENIAGVITLGAAADALQVEKWTEETLSSRDELEQKLEKRIPGLRIHGKLSPRVANTSFMTFPGVEGEGIVALLDREGFSVSAGPACSSGIAEPSRTLTALGCSRSEALSALRISLPGPIAPETIDRLVEATVSAVERLRKKR